MRFVKGAQVVANRHFLHFADCAEIATRKHFKREPWLTAGVNGSHSENSLHYVFKAWDLRVWKDGEDSSKGRFSCKACENFAADLRVILGVLYDVVVHYDKTGAYVTHIHTEYDPR